MVPSGSEPKKKAGSILFSKLVPRARHSLYKGKSDE